MAQASRDGNFVTTLLGASNADGKTPITIYADPVTHRLLVDSAGGGSGTVTSVSVVTANGFSGTVATATTTPAITMQTTITGILKGDGNAISAGAAGDVDSILPTQTSNNGKFLTTNGTNSSWGTPAGSGTVNSGTAGQLAYYASSTNAVSGNANVTVSGSALTLGVATSAQGSLKLSGATSGALTITSPATSSGTLTLPAGTTDFSATGGTSQVVKQTSTGAAFTVAQLAASDLSNGTTGTGAVVLATGSISGNAATATALASARTLWGQSFDGTGNVSGNLTAVGNITGGASSMTITAGTGNSRTLALQSTTSGGTATTFLTGNADQTSTFAAGISGTGAWTLTGGAGNMTILSGTGASRTMILQTTSSGSAAQTNLTLNADQSSTFSGALSIGTSNAFTTGTIELGAASDTTLSRSSAGVLAVEGVVVDTVSATNTLTNKRITKRVLSAASYTTDTGSSINGDTQDMFIVTAQTGALKFNNPTGTPTDGQTFIISVASSTTSARALTWDTSYGATTVALPTTTAATTATLTIGFIWSASKSLWQCVAVA